MTIIRYALVLLCCGILLCENSPTGGSPSDDGPGLITAPREHASLLDGDTFTVKWTNGLDDVALYYNMNDSAQNYTDALWHEFPDSLVIAVGPDSARVRTPLLYYFNSTNFRIRVEDRVTGRTSETGQLDLDNIVLLSPAGGETFAVGESIPIRFKRNVYMTRVFLYLVVGQRGVSLTPADINFSAMGTGSVTMEFDTVWTLGTEFWGAGATPYPSDSCRIYAYTYYLGSLYAGDPLGKNTDHNRVPFRVADR